jgi:hypothetical protein
MPATAARFRGFGERGVVAPPMYLRIFRLQVKALSQAPV